MLQLLHTNEEWKKVKVIVLSGRISSQDAEKISALRGGRYTLKDDNHPE